MVPKDVNLRTLSNSNFACAARSIRENNQVRRFLRTRILLTLDPFGLHLNMQWGSPRDTQTHYKKPKTQNPKPYRKMLQADPWSPKPTSHKP